MNRREVLETAINLTYGDRNKDYGDPRDNHAEIALASTLALGKYISSYDVATILIMVKILRDKHGRKPDNSIDLAAYAAIREELVSNQSVLQRSLDNVGLKICQELYEGHLENTDAIEASRNQSAAQ